MEKKITFAQANALLESQNIAPLAKERVFLHEGIGRILAESIIAKEAMPNTPLSNMDGYAFNANFKDSKTFKILGKNKAGDAMQTLPLDAPYAIKTFTGAKIPHNANMLVPLEMCIVLNDSLTITTLPEIGQFIRKVGDNYQKGEILLSKGTCLNANHIGLLASLNQVFISVFAKPKVGILVSGNELLEIGESGDGIYNANGHLLFAKVLENGGIPKLYPILKDNRKIVESYVNLALEECDIVISSGGASVGDYDFIAKLCKERVQEVVFQGVAIKPGQHSTYARFCNKHFFALPGFPNATLVTFELFVRGVLHRMLGTNLPHIKLKLPLAQEIHKTDTRLEFRVCNVRNIHGNFQIDFEGKKNFQSAILNNFCPLDSARVGLCLVRSSMKIGDIAEVILLY